MSFYECLKAYPESAASASRMALTAKRLGYGGIIVCNQDPKGIFRPSAARRIKGIKLIIGSEIAASNPKALKSKISSLRPNYPFLVVRSATEEIIRASCEDPNVDLLIPLSDSRRPLGIASARAAKANKVAIGIDLSPMIFLCGNSRSRWLEFAKGNLQIARKFKLALAITAGARSHLDLKAPRDLLALAKVAGFEPNEAKEALEQPRYIVEQNEKKWLGPGVELL